MLTRFIRRQLILFGTLTVIAIVVLGWYYLRIPSLVGIGQYTLKAHLPASGGLYPTDNVFYRGITIGKVTAVEPTEQGGGSAAAGPWRRRLAGGRRVGDARHHPRAHPRAERVDRGEGRRSEPHRIGAVSYTPGPLAALR